MSHLDRARRNQHLCSSFKPAASLPPGRHNGRPGDFLEACFRAGGYLERKLMSDILELSLRSESVPVKIDGKSYTLREASLETGMKLRDANAAALILKDGKVTGTRGTAGIEAVVISECLYDENNQRVNLGVVKSWPDKVTTKLFEKISEISGFSREQTIEELEQKLTRLKQLQENRKNS